MSGKYRAGWGIALLLVVLALARVAAKHVGEYLARPETPPSQPVVQPQVEEERDEFQEGFDAGLQAYADQKREAGNDPSIDPRRIDPPPGKSADWNKGFRHGVESADFGTRPF